MKKRGFQYTGRLLLVAIGISAGFFAVFYRLVELHIVDRERFASVISQSRMRFDTLEARRGNIVDSRGSLLASTQMYFEVGVDPKVVRIEDSDKIPQLAALLGLPASTVQRAFERRMIERRGPNGPELVLARWNKLAEMVEPDRYQEIRELDISGVYGNRTFHRTYPADTHAAHILGFINREGTAVMGIESEMDFYLRGQHGWRESERDGLQREVARFRTREVDARNGLHIELTVDSVIQHMVESVVAELVENFAPKGISVIVSEPATGDILALANYPTFDPNRFNRFPVDHHRNRAVTDLFEPGSTFKIVPAAGALNEGLVVPTDRFDCGLSSAEYRGRNVRLPRDVSEMGESSVAEIVARSSNRGAAHLGIRLGSQRLHNYAEHFGFGERTGILAGGEVSGVLHDVRNWDGLTISRLPMGHAVAATPLQVHQAMSVIANDGVLMKPRLVRRVFDDDGDTVASIRPRAKRRVLTTETSRTMAAMLAEAVGPRGTARRAVIDGYEVAGKTGTTQKLVDGRYSSQHHVASFVGFLPASRPRVLISVIVDEPQTRGSGYGGVVAAPAFRSIAEQIIPYLNIQPEEGFGRHYLAGAFSESGDGSSN